MLFYNPSQLFAQDKSLNNKNPVSSKQKTLYVEKLNLDEDQTRLFKAINQKFQENVSALNIKSKSKAAEKKIRKLEEKRDKDLKELLSVKQFETYIKLRREERKKLKTLIRKSNGQ